MPWIVLMYASEAFYTYSRQKIDFTCNRLEIHLSRILFCNKLLRNLADETACGGTNIQIECQSYAYGFSIQQMCPTRPASPYSKCSKYLDIVMFPINANSAPNVPPTWAPHRNLVDEKTCSGFNLQTTCSSRQAYPW